MAREEDIDAGMCDSIKFYITYTIYNQDDCPQKGSETEFVM
jgi:hypothetical protein